MPREHTFGGECLNCPRGLEWLLIRLLAGNLDVIALDKNREQDHACGLALVVSVFIADQ
jgi:hypothetical protein